jgi:hypothetical protein
MRVRGARDAQADVRPANLEVDRLLGHAAGFTR